MSSSVRVIAVILGVFAVVSLVFEKQEVFQLKKQYDAASLTATDRFMVEAEQLHEWNKSTSSEACPPSVETTTTTTQAPAAEATVPLPVTTKTTTTVTTTISPEQPLFVLSLPNSADLAIPRYLECAGYDSSKYGRRWSGVKNQKNEKVSLGKCMLNNAQTNQPTLEGCHAPDMNESFSVYSDLQYLNAPYLKQGRPYFPPQCHDPVLSPGALERLYDQFPTATILNVVRDPIEWHQSLSWYFPKYWDEWCNPTHDNVFPSGSGSNNQTRSERDMVAFYMQYQHRLKQFVKHHATTWKYVEVQLDDDSPESIGNHLQEQLGFPSQCWTKSTQGNTPIQYDPDIPTVLQDQVRPNDVGFPIWSVAMPKAGTSTLHDYMLCGLGTWTAAHQWTAKSVEPYEVVPIGKCLKENAQNDHYPFFDRCGQSLVYSDTGILGGICYYAFLELDGLERFYKSYPYGTIVNTIRNTKSWVSSAFRWKDLPKRWVKAGCDPSVFPTNVNTTQEEWGDWYEGLQNGIRKFAKEHPTLTYIEVPLSDQAGTILNDIFRFPDSCWGHHNVNYKNKETTSGTASTRRLTVETDQWSWLEDSSL